MDEHRNLSASLTVHDNTGPLARRLGYSNEILRERADQARPVPRGRAPRIVTLSVRVALIVVPPSGADASVMEALGSVGGVVDIVSGVECEVGDAS